MQDLSVGCGAYDRTWPLIAKTISVEGASLAWTILPPEEIFLRGMLGHEFDVTEMSFSSYLLDVFLISIHTIISIIADYPRLHGFGINKDPQLKSV